MKQLFTLLIPAPYRVSSSAYVASIAQSGTFGPEYDEQTDSDPLLEPLTTHHRGMSAQQGLSI